METSVVGLGQPLHQHEPAGERGEVRMQMSEVRGRDARVARIGRKATAAVTGFMQPRAVGAHQLEGVTQVKQRRGGLGAALTWS